MKSKGFDHIFFLIHKYLYEPYDIFALFDLKFIRTLFSIERLISVISTKKIHYMT